MTTERRSDRPRTECRCTRSVTRPRHFGEDSEIYQSRMTPTIRDLKSAPLYIDDTASLNVRQFEARARRMHQRKPLQLLVIDHIHDFDVDPRMARFEYGRKPSPGWPPG